MPVPSSLALTNIADGSSAVAADHRNNFTAIQTAVNAIIGFLTGASTGSTFRYNGTDWAPTTNILLDNANSKVTLGGDTNLYRSAAGSLATDGNLVSRPGTTGQVSLTTPSGFPGVAFGITFDTTLVRGGAANLQANGSLQTGFWLGTGSVTAAHSHPALVMGPTVAGADPATTADSGVLYWTGTNLKFRKPSNGTVTTLV